MNSLNQNALGILDSLPAALQNRYATKKFDATKKISEERIQLILESMRLAPSSLGLQPWKFYVVTNPQVRKQLTPVSYNQPQIETCSHLVVLAGLKTINPAYVEKYIQKTAQIRGISTKDLEAYQGMILGYLKSQASPDAMTAWNSRQVYLAFGFGMLSAALLGVDACPMEGIQAQDYNKILKVDDQYSTLAALALGYRDPSDTLAQMKKSRFDSSDVIQFVE